MRRSTFSRLGTALFMAVAFTAGTTTSAGAQSAEAPSLSATSAVRDAAPAGTLNSAESARPAGVDAARGSGATLAERRPAGLTRTQEETRSEAPAPRQESGNTRTNTALMIVGAAAVVLGAAVGDEAGTVLIIGGAGIGLFGLYRLLN